MANEKPTKEVKEKAPKVAKEKQVTIASIFKELAIKSNKDRKQLVEKIVAKLRTSGITETKKGTPIEEAVTRQLPSMLTDIKKERKGWWANYTIVENEKEIKIVLKA